MFDNSIEPGTPTGQFRRRSVHNEEKPIREATPAEERRHRQAADAHTDDVAKRHNLYTAERRSSRIYYSDYQQKSEVMRAKPQAITTKLDDRQTVSAMLDLAQSRGWQTLKLRGRDSFRREAWVQANVRGITTEGYQPKNTDLQEAERRKTAAAPVAVPVKEAPASRTARKTKEATEPAQRSQEKAVWNAVETNGKRAREQDSVKPAEKPVEPSPAAAVAA
jgi:hypothetical protein